MAIRNVFSDDNDNEMTCYLNDNGFLFIKVGPQGDDQGSGFITLDKTDVQALIKELTKLEGEMEE
jgi:hypothetical protein